MGDRARGAMWEAAYTVAGGAVGCVADTLGRVIGGSSVRERLGGGEPLPQDVRPLWFHGASVGELTTLRPLVAEVRQRHPGIRWGVTTTTVTGREAADRQFPDADFRRLLPLDAWPATGRFLKTVHPGAVLIVETELWPKLLLSLERRAVPVGLASARLTNRSMRRYRRARGLFRRVLGTIDLIAARGEEDRKRFVELGAPPDRVLALGNTKLDALADADGRAAAVDDARFARILGDRHLVVWGCLRPGEEDLAVEVIRRVGERSRALWVLAPRHLPEFDRVAATLERSGLAFVRWSKGVDREGGSSRVLLLDTLGELKHFYARSDVAVVGGTFGGGYGGHNLMEPAMFGVPVLFGTDTASWPDDAERLIDTGGGRQVHGPGDLTDAVSEVLGDPEVRNRMGGAAREAAEQGRGASRRVVDALDGLGFFDRVTGAVVSGP